MGPDYATQVPYPAAATVRHATELAQEIANSRDSLELTNRRLREILDRLEV